MRVLVYPHVLHGGQVHSVAENSSGSRVLTAGKDGAVYVWNTDELLALNATDQKSLKQALDSLQYQRLELHSTAVRRAQWNPHHDSEFVSADTNGVVIWYDTATSQQRQLYPFDDSNPASIIDLSWSADGRLIAWSSLDGKVHLIDLLHNTYQELTLLLKSQKLVPQRSIQFDPTNKYLITVGDDTSVYIYQYQYLVSLKNYQFKVQATITRLLNQNNASIDYRRTSWSPGGQYVCIPSSSKNKTTLITALSRNDAWNNAVNLVGHDTACEVVRYHPRIFSGAKEAPYANVIATAGSDRRLAIWNTAKDTPILVLEQLVSGSIVDIAWHSTGSSLFFATADGYLAVVSFDDGELGSEIDSQTAALLLVEPKDPKPFNAKPELANPRSKNASILLLEGKDAVSILERKKEETPVLQEKQVTEAPVKQVVTDFVPEVVEAEPVENKPESGDILGSVMERKTRSSLRIKNDKAAKNKNEKAEKEKAEKEKAEKEKAEKEKTEKEKAEKNDKNGNSEKLDKSEKDKEAKPELKQKVTTKNGKKRIQPVLVSNNGNEAPDPISIESRMPKTSKLVMEFDKPSLNVSDEQYKRLKRQKVDEPKKKRELEPVKFVGSVVVNPNTVFSKTRLATPKVRLGFLLASSLESNGFVLDIKNGSGNDTRPSRITYYKKDKQIWTDFIPKFLHLSTEGLAFWAISTSDGDILTYSHTSGRRLLPPMVLGSPLAFLESHGKFLMAITNIGELYVWDMEAKKMHLRSPLSLNSLLDNNTKYLDEGLSRSDKITLCSITSVGVPLITLSNGSGYLYNDDLGAWQTITESWWAFGSHYWDSLSNDNSNKPQSSSLLDNENGELIIKLLENKTNEEIIRGSRTSRGKFFNKISKNMLMKEGFEQLENTISVSHLENRILCCEILGEKRDFHQFFISYVKRVCELGLKAKVFEICNQLLGPDTKPPDWQQTICGYDKHELLKEVILNCSDLRDSQRILTHFAKKVGVL